MHILINPTGKPGKFRAVDWVVELLNLFTKEGFSLEFRYRHLIEHPTGHIQRVIFEQNYREHFEGVTAHRDISTGARDDREQLLHHQENIRAFRGRYEKDVWGAPRDVGQERHTQAKVGTNKRV